MKKIIILIVAISLFACSTSTESDTDPKIYLTPASANVSIGGQTSVDIVIEDNQKSFFGISMQISYDNTKLSFIDSTGFVAGAMFDQSAISFAQKNGSTIHLSLTQLNGLASTSGSGTVGTLTFQAIAAGNSVIDFQEDDLIFYDSNGSEIKISALDVESAAITVQ